MPKDLLVGKKTGLDEQRALAGTQGEKDSSWPLEERESLQQDYKDSIGSGREKIRETKGHLELHLVSAIKDSNKCFYKYISHKRRAKENLIINGCRGTQRQRMRQRLRYLMPSLPQTSIAIPAVGLGAHTSELEELIIDLTINTGLPMRTNKSYP